eukprot:2889939-Pleurochrysis_carterae.AAC.1
MVAGRCSASKHARDGAAPTSGRRPPYTPRVGTRIRQLASSRALYTSLFAARIQDADVTKQTKEAARKRKRGESSSEG